mmetsp:Transcript_54807/g.177304  ORF Transcript_54807/g.177304 Transcript_54807/m.177304 type:complete len:225 (-) Transcript_54807:420-1094(-)
MQLVEVQKLIAWWTGLDKERNVVLPKQGTLLTSLIRGGEFGVMPWEIDLEFVFASLGANPVLSACRSRSEDWELQADCVAEQVRRAVGGEEKVTVEEYLKPVPKLLHAKYGILSKVRVDVNDMIDIQFDELHDQPGSRQLYRVRLLGAEVNFYWHQWEYQFFQIYGGSLQKKVGTSGLVNKSEACGPDASHSACLRHRCLPAYAAMPDAGCVLEFPDWFAHTLT